MAENTPQKHSLDELSRLYSLKEQQERINTRILTITTGGLVGTSMSYNFEKNNSEKAIIKDLTAFIEDRPALSEYLSHEQTYETTQEKNVLTPKLNQELKTSLDNLRAEIPVHDWITYNILLSQKPTTPHSNTIGLAILTATTLSWLYNTYNSIKTHYSIKKIKKN